MEKKPSENNSLKVPKMWEKERKLLFWEKLLERISNTIFDYILRQDEKYRWDRNKPNSD